MWESVLNGIREDLVNNHLLVFERKVLGQSEDEPALAKTVIALNPLRFTYAVFTCEKVTGELLFQPFWEAIHRLERMTFKVIGMIVLLYRY